MASDTFSVAVGGDDGYRFHEKTTWPVEPTPGSNGGAEATTTLYATREFDAGPHYYISVALMRWDTSSIPDDATVAAVDLKVYLKNVANPDSLSLIGEWYDHGGTIDDSDWADVADGGAPAALSATALSGLTTSAVNTLSLTNVSNVNLTGYTGLRLGLTRLAADAAPTGYNGVEIASYEDASQEPQLVVTYTVASTGFILFPHMVV